MNYLNLGFFFFFFPSTVLALKNSRGSDGGLTLDELSEVEGLMSMGKPLPKSSGFLALSEVSTSPYRYNFGEYFKGIHKMILYLLKLR